MKCCLSVIDYDKNVNILEINQENTIFFVINCLFVCGNRKKFIPLHCQKVNRLFRLVVIDLGF